MSYNITSIETIRSTLILPARNLAAARSLEEDMPEFNPLPRGQTMQTKRFAFLRNTTGYEVPCLSAVESQDIKLDKLCWGGEGSGSSFGDLEKHPDSAFARFIALTEGEGDFVVIWEGGDSIEGLHIEDGKAYIRQVNFVLS